MGGDPPQAKGNSFSLKGRASSGGQTYTGSARMYGIHLGDELAGWEPKVRLELGYKKIKQQIIIYANRRNRGKGFHRKVSGIRVKETGNGGHPSA